MKRMDGEEEEREMEGGHSISQTLDIRSHTIHKPPASQQHPSSFVIKPIHVLPPDSPVLLAGSARQGVAN